jgi:hypothetical protein
MRYANRLPALRVFGAFLNHIGATQIVFSTTHP